MCKGMTAREYNTEKRKGRTLVCLMLRIKERLSGEWKEVDRTFKAMLQSLGYKSNYKSLRDFKQVSNIITHI